MSVSLTVLIALGCLIGGAFAGSIITFLAMALCLVIGEHNEAKG